MTAMLETPTPEISDAAMTTQSGRFFNEEEIGVQGQANLADVLRTQKDTARAALDALSKLEQAKIITGTAATLPGLIGEISLDEARATIIDQGCIWRRNTDVIAREIAKNLPMQKLCGLSPEGSDLFTDEARLCEEKDGEISVYTSLISQKELDSGIKMANQDQWHGLLFRILVVA